MLFSFARPWQRYGTSIKIAWSRSQKAQRPSYLPIASIRSGKVGQSRVASIWEITVDNPESKSERPCHSAKIEKKAATRFSFFLCFEDVFIFPVEVSGSQVCASLLILLCSPHLRRNECLLGNKFVKQTLSSWCLLFLFYFVLSKSSNFVTLNLAKLFPILNKTLKTTINERKNFYTYNWSKKFSKIKKKPAHFHLLF